LTQPLRKPLPHREADDLAVEVEQLARYYVELPRECQLDVLALTRALWKRRHKEAAALKKISEREEARSRLTDVPQVKANVPKRKKDR